MTQRPRRTTTAKTVEYKELDSDLSFSQTMSSEEENEDWMPSRQKSNAPRKPAGTKAISKESKAPKVPKEPKPKVPKEPKPKVPKEPKPKVPKEPKPRAPRKPPAKRKLDIPEASQDLVAPELLHSKRARIGPEKSNTTVQYQNEEATADGLNEKSDEPGPSRMKQERLSFTVSEAHPDNRWVKDGPSSLGYSVKKEEQEDFTFEDPCTMKQTSSQQLPRTLRSPLAKSLRNELNMNWDLIEVLSTLTGVEQWVSVNIVTLLQEENTVPFMVRYRKDMINHMDADGVRDVHLVYEDLCALAKKTQSVIQTLKKDGNLTAELEQNLRNCRSAEELDHVYTPYKKGSKLTKARRAKALGLEDAASALLETPHMLYLNKWVQPGTEGLSTIEEVATGIEHILADMIAKDPDTLTFVKHLCENSHITIQSAVSKSALKDKEQEKKAPTHSKPGLHQNKKQDIEKFRLYFDFTCAIHRIQPHQTLAINRGESLKILTVKVNIPDRVKTDFTMWCINNRWKSKTFAREELRFMIKNAVEDSYKRLILPFLTRSYRTKLTTSAEKESIAMFVRNLRQRLLAGPVRGCVLMGVDPGFKHGCKVAILSPTSQILHTDIFNLLNSGTHQEADKVRHLLIKYGCTKIVIGNGTACRETESFFSDLISRRYFDPLDVSYCITNEAGASIYSVSPEAVKEMPDMDPNLRSAVSIGRRVQDPMAELVKIDPKHIGIGTYQHDVAAGALKAALDGVVQECVSFVGVDINLCSETLMRHVAGLNAGRARNIAEWREQNGPFINREQLKLVKGMGPKSFQQCAGFIRINPQTLESSSSLPHSRPPIAEKTTTKKCKGKSCAAVPTTVNPLDQTCIHPESYHVAQRFVSLVGASVDQIGTVKLSQCVDNTVKNSSVEELSKTLDTSSETLKLIIDGLTQPPGFDIRQNFRQADFKRGIVSMNDLQVGAVLTGRVENTALFGAFVDIGVGRSGLIHKSKITLDKLPPSQRRRSLVLGPGERVEVRVLDVDRQRGRIGLDLIRVLQ
ncbi:S1 RNA-binding domain-containing protein 1 [Eucyclogobius newberryi]|uniref:S1 RNA-binding domain-containing protein 1 n=1 Tax=Eucyclogobius newberryi TaxID=166745 RepID=UPI003B5AD89D